MHDTVWTFHRKHLINVKKFVIDCANILRQHSTCYFLATFSVRCLSLLITQHKISERICEIFLENLFSDANLITDTVWRNYNKQTSKYVSKFPSALSESSFFSHEGKAIPGRYLDFRSLLLRSSKFPTICNTFAEQKKKILNAIQAVPTLELLKQIAADCLPSILLVDLIYYNVLRTVAI